MNSSDAPGHSRPILFGGDTDWSLWLQRISKSDQTPCKGRRNGLSSSLKRVAPAFRPVSVRNFTSHVVYQPDLAADPFLDDMQIKGREKGEIIPSRPPAAGMIGASAIDLMDYGEVWQTVEIFKRERAGQGPLDICVMVLDKNGTVSGNCKREKACPRALDE